MTDSSCLSCISTTTYINDYIELVSCLCSHERLANNNFQSLKSEILINVSLINSNFSCSRYKIYSCD